MISSNIAKRYARALFDIASEEQGLGKYGGELEAFSSVVEKSPELKSFLLDPVFDEPQKRAVVGDLIARTGVSPLLANFLNLLVDKRRLGILPQIQGCYREMIDEALKNIRVEVKTALPLSDGMEKKLAGRLAAMTGKKVIMAIEEDASLLGGIVVTIGDTRYDGSIRTQLDKIRNLLGEES